MSETAFHELEKSVAKQGLPDVARSAESAAFWLLIAALAWAPFPLGSNRLWSASLLCLLICVCWGLWLASFWSKPGKILPLLRPVAGPALLLMLPVLWGFVQLAPFVPASWAHPIWGLAADVLGHPLRGSISLSPWRSGTALMKLISFGMAAWLSYALTQRSERASQLLSSFIVIAAAYAAYDLAMGLMDLRQFQLFYSYQPVGNLVASPFVDHNNFATYMGLASVCSAARLLSLMSGAIVTSRGAARLFMSAQNLFFGKGFLTTLALVLTSSMLIASGSRAGFLATLTGWMVLLLFAWARSKQSRWNFTAVSIGAVIAIVIFLINGQDLETRFGDVIGVRNPDEIRLVLWSAAARMAASSPWLGLGPGTFEPAYPAYANQVFPLIMDKAHNDYLELAADWGIMATALWCAGIAWAACICALGSVRRKRNWAYPLAGVSATALVAFHSAFDFSLQIPAVALTFSVLLGMGIAHAFSQNRLLGEADPNRISRIGNHANS